jgi:hypothetical protein
MEIRGFTWRRKWGLDHSADVSRLSSVMNAEHRIAKASDEPFCRRTSADLRRGVGGHATCDDLSNGLDVAEDVLRPNYDQIRFFYRGVNAVRKPPNQVTRISLSITRQTVGSLRMTRIPVSMTSVKSSPSPGIFGCDNDPQR